MTLLDDAPAAKKTQWDGPRPEQQFYQNYTSEEDKQRTNVHYEQPARFFECITGGEWNVYSCNLWDTAADDTESQEAKLDFVAQLAELKPGQRLLDVGCGWGGPLTYLSRTYGVRGVGLTLSSKQKRAAEERIARHGADVTIHECHWRDFEDAQGFDAIYTDEVIVHFSDLGSFFRKAHALLRPGGMMVNKELHFTHSRYSRLTRSLVAINEIYGLTANYRTLAQELALLDEADFEVQGVHPIARSHYGKTADRWLENMHTHRDELRELVGPEYYHEFRRYLKLARHAVVSHRGTLDVVVARRLDHES